MIIRWLAHLFGTTLLIVMLAGWGVITPASAQATSTPSVKITTDVAPEFPSGITFSAEIPHEPHLDVIGASLLYRISDDETLNLAVVPGSALEFGDSSLKVSVFVDLQSEFIPMGVELTFSWELVSGHDIALQTHEESTSWMDTRFDWTTLSTDQVTLYTYDTSPEFAEQMLNASQQTMTNLEQSYGLETLDPIVIWIYPEYEDFMGSMPSNTRESIAGISYPGSAVVAAIISDGDDREFGRVIPHEISHQVLFQATENPFAFPPVWFDEGIATHTQIGGTDHYTGMVYRAWSDGSLFDISSLNATFPFQPVQATLAYASSWSMLSYLEETYGVDGIARMIETFGKGLPTDEAIQIAIGISTADLNDAWHNWVGNNPA